MTGETPPSPALLKEADGARTGPGGLEPGETYEFSRAVTEEMST